MALITGTVSDIGMQPLSGDLSVTSVEFRPEGDVLVAPEIRSFPIVAGVVSAELLAGPCRVTIRVGSHARRSFDVVVPNVASLPLAALVESATEYEPAVVSVVAGHRLAAEAAAGRAEDAAEGAEVAASAAATSAAVAGTRAGVAEGHASDAAGSASAAAGSATAAGTARNGAVTARSGAESARDAAAGSATAAGSARDGAVAARGGAELARDAADGHAGRAEAAANSFGITATASTGAPGSSTSVTVTGDGPAYGLSFTVPRGDKGDKGDRGDDGDVSQAKLDAAVASLVDNAPEALNTLSELATSLGNDPNFATTVSTEIGKRALIDGAPAAYNTLGKLVAALQNHELGGSTDASLLTGALTSAVNVHDSVFTISIGGVDYDMPLGLAMLGFNATLDGLIDQQTGEIIHTHDGADISGALTDQVDASAAMVHSSHPGMGGEFEMPISELAYGLIDMSSYFAGKSDVGHTHPVSDLTTTGTASSTTYLRGDGIWATPTNTTYSVPSQAEAEAGTATTGRAFSAQRAHQAAIAASGKKDWQGTQAQYDALGTKDADRTYWIV